MTQEQTSIEPRSLRGNGIMICGCLLGLVSAVALAMSGNVCGAFLEALFFRPSPGANSGGNPLADLGTRMLRLSWAPVGLAAGTALTLVGLQQSVRRVGRSKVTSVLVLLSAIIAGLGAFQIKSGVLQTEVTLQVAATLGPRTTANSRPIEADFEETPEEAVEPTWPPPSDGLARGWMLLTIAQVLLTSAATAQARTRTQHMTSSRDGSKEDLAVTVLVGAFGVIVSWSWFTSGLAIERLVGQESFKPSELVAQVNHILSSTAWGAWALMASMSVLAISTGFNGLSRSSTSASRSTS